MGGVMTSHFLYRRREFIALLGGAAISCPLTALAQQAKRIPRIGVLWHAGNEQEEAIYLGALRQGFSELGYVEGKNFVLENRFAAEHYDRFDALAAELVAAKVDVIVAVTTQAALAAQRATSTMPVVFVVVTDPVRSKLVDSLAHPGHNVTGLSNINFDLSAKRLEIFKDAVPALSKVVLLGNPKGAGPVSAAARKQHIAAAASLGLQVIEIEASEPNGIEPAVGVIKDHGAGLVVLPDSMLFNERKRIAQLAIAYGTPSVSFNAEMADAGILISYGASFLVDFRKVAVYVDKILKGAKPADLPVEQPVQLELIINSKTARALHIDIPPSLLSRADRVIE